MLPRRTRRCYASSCIRAFASPTRSSPQRISRLPQSAAHDRGVDNRGTAQLPHREKAAIARARNLLDLVGIDVRGIDRYPHEFSGGQRQRIAIARALAMQPEVLIADEAVSAPDVSVQAQVLELLERLREQLNLTILFITHDLRAAARLCVTMAVMLNGRIVEYGSAQEVFLAPKHDYPRALLAAAPRMRHFAPASP